MILKDVRESRAVMKKMIEAGAKTAAAKTMLASIQKLREVLETNRTRGASKDYLRELEKQGRDAILADLLISQTEARSNIYKQIADLEKRYVKDYERDFQLHDFRLKQFERRLYAKTPAELVEMVSAYTSGQAQYDDPAFVDCIGAALIDRNVDDVAGEFREAAVAKEYDRPYMRSDEGKLLDQQLRLNKFVNNAVLLADDAGGTFAMTFDELWESSEPDQEEDE